MSYITFDKNGKSHIAVKMISKVTGEHLTARCWCWNWNLLELGTCWMEDKPSKPICKMCIRLMSQPNKIEMLQKT